MASLAPEPTTTCRPSNRTTEGVVGLPSTLGRTVGIPNSLTWATADSVVPRSIPKARDRSGGLIRRSIQPPRA